MATVYVMIPVELRRSPDNTLPGGQPGTPDNTLPEIPPEVWPTPPSGEAPTHPIYVPVYPDQGLPPAGATKPSPPGTGGTETPDQSLPGSQPSAGQLPGPIYVPIYPR